MENFLPNMTQVGEEDEKLDIMTMKKDKNLEELQNSTQVFQDINGRQFEELCSCVTEEAKEASDAREQALAMTLCSMQEKMDQNSTETSTKVSYILKRVEKVDKELAATKSDNLTSEMLQIDVIDDMRDDICELKGDVRVLIRDLRMNMQNTSNLHHEIWVVKDDVKNVTKNFKDFKELEEIEDEVLENEILEVRNEMCEVTDKLTADLEKRGDELMDVLTAMKSFKDDLKSFKDDLKSFKDDLNDAMNKRKIDKDDITNLRNDVMCELRNFSEELRVVKDKTRGAKVGQNEMVGVQEVMLYELRKVTDEVSCVKRDLRDIGVEVTDELGMGVGGRLRDVRHELKKIRHEMKAAKDEERELTDADLDLIKEFNDIVRGAEGDHVQNKRPTLDDLRETFREVMTTLIINKKRERDSRYPTLKRNKRLRKQSNCDERGTASVSSTSVYPSFAYSSDSDSSASLDSDSS